MSIPFTQYLLPNGQRRAQQIDRPADIESLAEKFIASGGRYECEVLTTGHVSFTAVKEIDPDDGPQDVVIEVCENGPAVETAVDRVVLKSQAFL